MASAIGPVFPVIPGNTYTISLTPDGLYQSPNTTAPTFKVAQVSDLKEHKEKIAALEDLNASLKTRLGHVRALVKEAKEKGTAIISLADLEIALETE